MPLSSFSRRWGESLREGPDSTRERMRTFVKTVQSEWDSECTPVDMRLRRRPVAVEDAETTQQIIEILAGVTRQR